MTKNSRFTFVKIGGYILMGFFVLIIIISFGMPSDWMARKGIGQNTVAIVNSEEISRLDYIRTIDRALGANKNDETPEAKSAKQRVLNDMIYVKLQAQFAKKMGIKVSDDSVSDMIRRRYTVEGKFNELIFKRDLEKQRFTIQSYHDEIKSYMLINEMWRLLLSGIGASSDEVIFSNAVKNSSFQIQYAFISNDEIKKKVNASQITEAEIDAEMAKNKKDIKDPSTDRARFKSILSDKKLEAAKKAIITSVDESASKGARFTQTSQILGGRVAVSESFKAGEPVKEQGKGGKILYPLADSEVFKNSFMSLEQGASSRAITAYDGVYVFTFTKKSIKFEKPAEKDVASVQREVLTVKQQALQSSLLMPFFEKSKIIRNLPEESVAQ